MPTFSGFDARTPGKRASRASNMVSLLSAVGGGHQAAVLHDPADRSTTDADAEERKMKRMSAAARTSSAAARTSSAGAAALSVLGYQRVSRAQRWQTPRGTRAPTSLVSGAGHTRARRSMRVRTIVAVRSAQREQALSEAASVAASVAAVEAAQTVEARAEAVEAARAEAVEAARAEAVEAARAAAASPMAAVVALAPWVTALLALAAALALAFVVAVQLRDDAAPRRAAPSPSKTTKRR